MNNHLWTVWLWIWHAQSYKWRIHCLPLQCLLHFLAVLVWPMLTTMKIMFYFHINRCILIDIWLQLTVISTSFIWHSFFDTNHTFIDTAILIWCMHLLYYNCLLYFSYLMCKLWWYSVNFDDTVFILTSFIDTSF